MRLKAATDNLKRAALETVPSGLYGRLTFSSAITSAYCAASVSTATSFQFLAAERTMAGPPISMFSIASSNVQFGLATVASNGYKFTANKSIFSMPYCSIAATCSGKSRRPNKPPCTFGCNVFTRPSNISGKPVKSLTSLTGILLSRNNLAVPPVDRISTPKDCKFLANSIMPVLSETLIKALLMVAMRCAYSMIILNCIAPFFCAKCCD